MKKDKHLTSEEFKSKIDNHEDFILVDVLSEQDYHQAHIRGAINIPLVELAVKANQWLHRAIDIIVYSAGPTCKGAEFSQEILGKMGFRVWTLEGGLDNWVKNNFPIEGDPNYKPHPILTRPSMKKKAAKLNFQK